jgi:hypothetical protein
MRVHIPHRLREKHIMDDRAKLFGDDCGVDCIHGGEFTMDHSDFPAGFLRFVMTCSFELGAFRDLSAVGHG